jgi:hypothetical protein
MRRGLLFAAAALLAAPLSAEQVTKKFDYKPVDSIQDIRLSLDKIKINQIVFHLAREVGAGLRRSTSEAVVRIDNDGQFPVAVGVAVAVMDEEGNLVAAGSGGTRVGWLLAGERDAAAIKFPFVYRNFSKAKTFVITMEVEPKPGTVTPTPAP